MFTVKATQFHTGRGETHEVGDVYEVETFEEVENLRALRFAALVETAPEPAPAASTPVPVMTTKDVK